MSGIEDMNDAELLAALTGHVGSDPRRKEIIIKLPVLTEEDLTRLDEKDSCCPICFTSFLAILASEEMAHAMDSPATAIEDLGVTRLAETCGHLFCRKDITTWIQQNDSCPTCRRPYIVNPELPDTELDQSNGRDTRYADSPAGMRDALRSPALIALMRNLRDHDWEGHEVRDAREDDDPTHDDREEFIGLYS